MSPTVQRCGLEMNRYVCESESRGSSRKGHSRKKSADLLSGIRLLGTRRIPLKVASAAFRSSYVSGFGPVMTRA